MWASPSRFAKQSPFSPWPNNNQTNALLQHRDQAKEGTRHLIPFYEAFRYPNAKQRDAITPINPARASNPDTTPPWTIVHRRYRSHSFSCQQKLTPNIPTHVKVLDCHIWHLSSFRDEGRDPIFFQRISFNFVNALPSALKFRRKFAEKSAKSTESDDPGDKNFCEK
jgi:hypothetical protein